jgi:hypothetical protein
MARNKVLLGSNEEIKAKPINTIAGRGGIVSFRRNLRASVRGLWTGALTKRQALSTFRAAIERGIEQAWREGAAECGIQPDELTVQELTARDEFIFEQNDFATDFIDTIADQSKANGGSLTPLLQRAEMWVNRYNDAKTQGKVLACADFKAQWFIGPTEKHCPSCAGFDKRVYRFSTWDRNNALPQNRCLACNGFNCQCRLDPTDRPITKGPFPRRLVKC